MPLIKLKSTVLLYPPSAILSKKFVLRYNSELIEIEDPDSSVSYLFDLLSHSRELTDVQAAFHARYPEVSFDEYINTVKELGLIEQLDIDTHTLSENDKVRWSRNLEFFNTLIPFGENKYDVQNRIKNSQVCLLGCGGLGSHVLFELAALGVEKITITDFDTIELSNMNRQILYKNSDIGKEKVFTAKERITEFNPALQIRTNSLRISSAEQVKEIIAGHDLVICVADKPRNKMVKWLNESCCQLHIPFINGGLDQRRAQFYSVIPGVTGCVECWHSAVSDDSIQKKIINTDIDIGKDYLAPAPALSALVSVATGVIMSEAIKILTGLQAPALGNKTKCYSFDDISILDSETWSLNPYCPCCSNTAP